MGIFRKSHVGSRLAFPIQNKMSMAEALSHSFAWIAFLKKSLNVRGVAVLGWVVHVMKGQLLPKIGGGGVDKTTATL